MNKTVKKELKKCFAASMAITLAFFAGMFVVTLMSNFDWTLLVVTVLFVYLSLSSIISALKLKEEDENNK